MRRSELVDFIYQRHRDIFDHDSAKRFVNFMMQEIDAVLYAGESLPFNFGQIYPEYTDEGRKWTNPGDGKLYKLGAIVKLRFKVSKSFLNRLLEYLVNEHGQANTPVLIGESGDEKYYFPRQDPEEVEEEDEEPDFGRED